MRAWHFVGDKLRDGRPVPADGVKLVHPEKPVICESGLHASLRPWDALQFAPGGVLCLVECGGTVLHQTDKLVCTERTILARMDAVPLLREFARMQALSVIHLWEAPDVVCDYLMTGDESSRAAARAAAWDAAGAAAGAAAWAAAGAAAWAATRDAAWAAAWDAAVAAAGKEFDQMVYDCFEDWL
jgi:hypothetical protein